MTAKTTLAASLKAAFEANRARVVLGTKMEAPKDAPPEQLAIIDLGEKTTKMKDGSKFHPILVKPVEGDEATVYSIPPDLALQLFEGRNANVDAYNGFFHLEPLKAEAPTETAAGNTDEAPTEQSAGDTTTDASGTEGTTPTEASAPTEEKPDEKKLAKEARDKETADRKAKKDAEKAEKEKQRKLAADARDERKKQEKLAQERRAKEKEEGSKKLKALAIFNSIPDGTEGKRAKVIEKFKAELDMGPAGANTYYQNFKSGHWK